MRRMRDERGQTVILVALCLTCILGFVGFATDVGVLLHAKRNLQIAADAAAIAGAKQINIDATQVTAAEYAASAQNGFTNGVNGTTVTPSYPAADGPHAGQAGYAEAIVTQPQPAFFMRLFSFTSTPVSARAVAFNGSQTGTSCITALNQTAPDTIHLQGSFNVDAPGCLVIDDSSNSNALEFTGGGGTLTAGGVGVVGGATGQLSDSTPLPVQGIAPYSDPLAPLVSPPTYSAGSCTAAPTGTTWGPATAGGTVCYSGNISVSKNVTMSAGVYVFTGTLSLQGHGSLTGTGVTIYLPGPSGSMDGGGSGNTTLNLTAPTSGAYNGILIYEDANNTNPIDLRGTPVANLTGIIYAPSAQLTLGGNTTENFTADIIVNKLYDFGNATINITNYTSTVSTSPLTTIALVE